MDAHPRTIEDSPALRATNVIRHLDGALDQRMLDAMSGVWTMLERASADAPSHARAVRARLFWESLSPGGGAAAVPVGAVHDLTPTWSDIGDDTTDAADAA